MSVYFVTRHPATERWARFAGRKGRLPFSIDTFIAHIDTATLAPGDVVMGTLPIHVIAQVVQRGAEFWALDIDVPESLRGKEMSATELAACKARLTRYEVREKACKTLAPKRAAQPEATDSVTVMLVSDAIAANYMGFKAQPTDRVLLLYTRKMENQQKMLKKLLGEHGVEKRSGLKFDDDDLATMQAQFEQALEERVADCAVFRLNLTGGTKPMSLALQKAGDRLAERGFKVYSEYVDLQHGRIVDLRSGAALAMPAVIDVRAAVQTSGKEPAGCMSSSRAFQQFMQRTDLALALLKFERIGILHQLAGQMADLLDGKTIKAVNGKPLIETNRNDAMNRRFTLTADGAKKANLGWLADNGDVAQVLRDCGVLWAERSGDTVLLEVGSLADVPYLQGTWLEALVASEIAKLAPDDWAAGVQLGTERGKNNEADALVCCANKTLLIEVKAANLSHQGGNGADKAAGTLYKLDAIGTDLAPAFGENWLVLRGKLDDIDNVRAQARHIKVISLENDGLVNLRTELTTWIDNARANCASMSKPRPLNLSEDAKRLDAQLGGKWPERQKPFSRANRAPSGGGSKHNPPKRR